jgi:hypothetical protein
MNRDARTLDLAKGHISLPFGGSLIVVAPRDG